jgi:hypothetical protein
MDGALAERLARVKAKCAARGVRLDPPRSLDEIERFERRAGVNVPDAYRAFLLDIGAGPSERVDHEFVYGTPAAAPVGAVGGRLYSGGRTFVRGRNGWYEVRPEHARERDRREGPPHYGLCPLERTLADDVGRALRPAQPFPLTAGWHWEDEANPDRDQIAAVHTGGQLYLGTDGCGINWALVVTGSERGRVWLVADEGAMPCDPPADFLAWYERWLDDQPLIPDGPV